jgi:hypothetical protein
MKMNACAVILFAAVLSLIPLYVRADDAPAADACRGLAIKWISPTECTQSASFAVRADQKLVVDVDQGNVHISTWDQAKAEVLIRHKGKDAAETVKHHQITLEQVDGEVRLIARSDGSTQNSVQVNDVNNGPQVTIIGGGNVVITNNGVAVTSGTTCDIEYEIRVPARFNANVKNHAGDVEASNLEGIIELVSSAGNVTTKKLAGKIKLSSSAGNVSSRDSAGALDLRSDAGYVSVIGFAGEGISAVSEAGNVAVEMTAQPKNDCFCRSAAGNVTLTLVKTLAVTLHPTTSAGNVESDFDRWAVNGGGPEMRLGCSAGNVRIIAE